MTGISKAGIVDAAKREKEFHPTRKGSPVPIQAWELRASTLSIAIDEINVLREELDELKAVIASRPF